MGFIDNILYKLDCYKKAKTKTLTHLHPNTIDVKTLYWNNKRNRSKQKKNAKKDNKKLRKDHETNKLKKTKIF